MNNIIMTDPKLASLEDNVVLRGYRGSIAHGTYEEKETNDDYDVMGIFMPPVSEVFGLNHTNTIERFIDEKLSEKKTRVWDIVYYSFPHFISLLAKQNPNVLMMLWLPGKFINKVSPIGEELIAKRDMFLTKEVYKSFVGYSKGQLHRMVYGSPTGQMGAKRKALVEKWGFDLKNAGHLIRLLKMGFEALSMGKIIVERPDSSMLLEIKRGEWSLERVTRYADVLFAQLDMALANSRLPDRVDMEKVNDFCVDLMGSFYSKYYVQEAE